jgi:hypothetical protein
MTGAHQETIRYKTKKRFGRLEVGFVKPSESYSFTIPYHTYRSHRWKFNTRHTNNALRKGLNASPTK